jgi:arabinofuranan 3-O-arabinosyltransferase
VSRAAASALVKVHRWLTAERLVLICGAVLGFFVLVLHDAGTTYIDTRPDLYLDPGRLLRECLSAWVPGTGLGVPNYDVGYLPSAAVVWAVQALGVEPWLSMRIWRLLLLIVAGWGARRLVADLSTSTDAVGPVARTSAALLYAANPYVVVSAATTPVMLPYALLPWLLLASRRSFVSPWTGGAAVGLVVFVMGGMNAGVVTAYMLLAVPVVGLYAWRRQGLSGRSVFVGLLVSGTAALFASAYWVTASLISFGTASVVAGATESPTTIAATSSFAEVMRGLGGWLLYGSDQLGPFRPGFTSYLTNPAVIVATFTLPVLAMVGAGISRAPLRFLAAGLTILGVLLMVGAHPVGDPSPFGRLLRWGFESVPGLIAFRTTGKAGAIAVLGLTLLAAVGVEAAVRRATRPALALLAPPLVAVLGLSVIPAWTGDLLPGRLDVPSYWRVAAQDLDTRGGSQRVLFVPGETNAVYRWRPRGVDDPVIALTQRRAIYTRSFADGPSSAWNSLLGMSQAMLDVRVPTRLVSAYARYVGASDVVARNDMVWEVMGAPRPATVDAALEDDTGLEPSALYGDAGRNVADGVAARPEEAFLAPVVRYAVADPAGPVSIAPAEGHLVIAGDNAALPAAIWAGLLDGERPFRLLAHTTSESLEETLAADGHVVLTDTNRRRVANYRRLDVTGPLLPADVDAVQSAAIGSVDDQTVAVYRGLASVSASSSGSAFGPTPSGRPYLAFDGDPGTAWEFGDFGTAVGQQLSVRFEQPITTQEVTLRRPRSLGARVESVAVSLGGSTARATFVAGDVATARFGVAATGETLTLRIDSVAGSGINQVGISEVESADVETEELTRLPLLPATVGDPVSVLLTRSSAEREERIGRLFELPASSTYRVRAELSGILGDDRWRRCRVVAEVDGRPVSMRLARTPRDGVADAIGCGDLRLGEGEHVLIDDGPGRIERMLLTPRTSVHVQPTAAAVEAPEVRSVREGYEVAVEPSRSERFLVVTEAYDARWTARLDGRDLGPPEELNGYAMGWRLPADQGGRLEVRFGPQVYLDLALAVSGVALAACLGAVLWRRTSAVKGIVRKLRRA